MLQELVCLECLNLFCKMGRMDQLWKTNWVSL